MNLMPEFLGNLLVTYVFTSQNVSFAVIAFFLYLAIRTSIDKVDGRVKDVEDCIIELQAIMRNKFPKLSFERSIAKYGQANSPIVLKDEFREFITKPELDKQIESKKNELFGWLKNKKPKTGLDAQDNVAFLVASGEIEKYLDLTKYKENLYLKGKTSEDAQGILGVYLFEILIPDLHLPDKDKPKEKVSKKE